MDRLAFFDLDDTLVDRQLAFASWLRDFADLHGLDEEARLAIAAADLGGEAPRETLHDVASSFGVTEDLPTFLAGYLEDMPRHVSPFPGVLHGLTRLRADGWRTAVITNGNTRMQRRKITRSGLKPLIDATMISEEVGLRKPDPRIFQLARDQVGAGATESGWMVGDLLHTDIAGGAAAGLRTIWLCPGGADPAPPLPADGRVVPDHICESVEQAFTLLEARP